MSRPLSAFACDFTFDFGILSIPFPTPYAGQHTHFVVTRLKDTKFDALHIKVNCESRPGHSCPRSSLCMCILSKQCPVSYTRTTPAHEKRSRGSLNQSHGLRARKSNRSAQATETTAPRACVSRRAPPTSSSPSGRRRYVPSGAPQCVMT